MLSSSGTEATIKYFLNFVKLWSPEIRPTIIMSDCDKAQMNAVMGVFLESTLLLCWWHVLCTMRMHFRMEEFPDLWNKVHEWVRASDQLFFFFQAEDGIRDLYVTGVQTCALPI